jgi:predicted nuclease with TOPRIM domain
MQHLELIISLTFSALTGVAGWMVGRKKQKNDFIGDLQSSIDLLADKNKSLFEEKLKQMEQISILQSKIIFFEKENISLKEWVEKLENQINELKKQVSKLESKK